MASGVDEAARSQAAAALGAVEAALDGLSLATSDPRSGASPDADGLWRVPTTDLPDLAQRALVLRHRLDAVLLAVVREADVRGLHASLGAASTAQWLALLARWEPAEARAVVADAAALAPGFAGGGAAEGHPAPTAHPDAGPADGPGPEGAVVGAELAAGRVDRGRAGAVLRALAHLPHDTSPADRAGAEAALATCARDLTARQVARAGRGLAEALAARRPDSDDPAEAAAVEEQERLAARRAEERARELYDERRVWWRERTDGSVEGGFRLDAVSAAPVVVLLEAAARRPEEAAALVGDGHDHGGPGDDAGRASGDGPGGAAEGPRGDGRPDDDLVSGPPSGDPPDHPPSGDPSRDDPPPDRRTRAQRAADALSQLCTWALAGQVDGVLLPSEPARYPQVTLTVELARLHAGLAGAGTLDALATGSAAAALTAGQVRTLACAAEVLPAVMAGPSQPLDVGRTRRLATRAQRAALALRDRGCVVPGCAVPAAGCIAHHLTGWAARGATDLANLALLCPSHHTQVHLQGWDLVVAASGVVEVVPPRWLDPDRRPRRHERHLLDRVRQP